MMLESAFNSDSPALPDRLEALRLRINDESYLCAAIQRLALVMSNELASAQADVRTPAQTDSNFTSKGGLYERKRRK